MKIKLVLLFLSLFLLSNLTSEVSQYELENSSKIFLNIESSHEPLLESKNYDVAPELVSELDLYLLPSQRLTSLKRKTILYTFEELSQYILKTQELHNCCSGLSPPIS